MATAEPAQVRESLSFGVGKCILADVKRQVPSARSGGAVQAAL